MTEGVLLAADGRRLFCAEFCAAPEAAEAAGGGGGAVVQPFYPVVALFKVGDARESLAPPTAPKPFYF